MKCSGLDVDSKEAIEVSFGELIAGVDPCFTTTPPNVFLSPGFIDLQVNGFAGADYCCPDEAQEIIAASLRAMFATGVTRLFPTVITGSPDNMLGAVVNLARAKEALPEGAAIAGFHLEGPHISPEDGPRGAHPRQWVRPPDIEEFRRWQGAAEGNIRLVTLSPEWPEAPGYIEAIVHEGVVASIGHTRATKEQLDDAVSAGATMSTHLGNGAHSQMSRHPNYLWDQMAEVRLVASFIVDGIHLGESFLKVALRAKGLERAVLVTDAVMPAGCKPGPYRLGEVEVELYDDGSVRMRGGTRLAGSALMMHRAISNVMRMTGINLREALSLATRNPARVGRITSRLRGLTPGERGDVVKFRFDDESKDIEILETYLGGECVYRRPSA